MTEVANTQDQANNAVAAEDDPLAALGIKRTFAYVDKNGKGYTVEEVEALKQQKSIKEKVGKLTNGNAELAAWIVENRTALLEALHVNVDKAKRVVNRKPMSDEMKAKMRDNMKARMADMQAKRAAKLAEKKAAKEAKAA